MTRKKGPARRKRAAYTDMPQKAKEDDTDIKYFAPKPVEEKKVDKNITDFLLKETGGRKKIPRDVDDIPQLEEPKRWYTNWYVLGTIFVLLLVIFTYYFNLQIAEINQDESEYTPEYVPNSQVYAPETGLRDEPETVEEPIMPQDLPKPEDINLNIKGLRPVGDFDRLDDKKSDLINDCNDSDRCKAMLKGYDKISLAAGSESYTLIMNDDGRIVDMKTSLDSDADFTIEASQEDLLALYNAVAINDEDTVIMKLSKMLPPTVLLKIADVLMK